MWSCSFSSKTFLHIPNYYVFLLVPFSFLNTFLCTLQWRVFSFLRLTFLYEMFFDIALLISPCFLICIPTLAIHLSFFILLLSLTGCLNTAHFSFWCCLVRSSFAWYRVLHSCEWTDAFLNSFSFPLYRTFLRNKLSIFPVRFCYTYHDATSDISKICATHVTVIGRWLLPKLCFEQK